MQVSPCDSWKTCPLYSLTNLDSLTDSDKVDARADQLKTGPPLWADLLAEDVFRREGAEHIGQGRGRDHQTDGLPRKQEQQEIERKRQPRNTDPERHAQSAAEKNQ